jgi:hypothetical protein
LLSLGGAPILVAQYYYFGRNKVQYTEFQWKVLKTKRFDIYYYPEMQALAERAAAHAESTYVELAQKFTHTVVVRIPLILYSSHFHFQQTNVIPEFIPEGVGGFFEFLKGRVVIPSQGSTEDFFHVIRHELTHVFMHSKLSKILSDHRLPGDRYVPLWFTEGLAEFWSNRWDTQAEMVLRDAVLNNYVVPLSDMSRIYGSFLMYKEGQAILQYIAETYGEEKILLLMDNIWRSTNFAQVMKHVIGKNFEEFDEQWIYSLKKRYYPGIATSELPTNASINVVNIGFNAKPIFYRTGGKRWVYFIGNHSGFTSIYRRDLDDKEAKPELIIEGERSDEFESFSFFQTRIDINENGILAFITKSGENDVIHLYDLEKKEQVRTIRFSKLVNVTSLSWSPDGTRLALAALEKSGNSDLYILDIKNESLRQLTNDFYDDRTPAWSPDGSTIAFSSDRTPFGVNGKYNLFLYKLETGTIEYLTPGNESYQSPSWSPEGNYLAFTSDFDGAQNIWMMKMNIDSSSKLPSRTMRKISRFATAAFDPAWTDTSALMFTAFEKFSFQIRSLEDVFTLFDTSATSYTFHTDMVGDRWEPPSVAGESIIGRFDYRGIYQLDVAQSQVSADPVFGTSGGAVLAMSDVLGNDQYYFLIYNNAQTKDELLESFNIAFSRISLGKRTNYAYGIFRLAGFRYDLGDPDLFYYERAYGGYFSLSYPLSVFRRIETGVVVTSSEKDNYEGLLPRKALLFSNSLSFISDNSLWGPSGPLDGHRAKLLFAYTADVQYSNVSYFTVLADYRHYFRIAQRSALALRGNVWYNEGKEARRFIMGGSWDLRGWPRWSLRGKKLWLTSAEFRFPFVDALGVRFPFGTVTFGPIRGAIFSDFGSVWDDEYLDTKGSVGFGFRFTLAGALVLRYDIGKKIERNLTQFQDGLFYQFFFGWDF